MSDGLIDDGPKQGVNLASGYFAGLPKHEQESLLIKEALLRCMIGAKRYLTIDLAWQALLTVERFDKQREREMRHLFPEGAIYGCQEEKAK